MEERSGLLRQLLASRRVLMVLDNAATEAQVRPLLPGAGGSLVLVTSRSVLPGLEVDERISLDVLAEDEAAALLAGLIGDGAGGGRAAGGGAGGGAVRAAAAGAADRRAAAGRPPGLAGGPAGRGCWPMSRTGWPGWRPGTCRCGPRSRCPTGSWPTEDARLFRLLGLHPGPDFDVAAAAAPGRDRGRGGGAGAGPAGGGVPGHRGRARAGSGCMTCCACSPAAPARRPTARPTGTPPRPAWSATTRTWPGSWIPALTRSCARRRQAAEQAGVPLPSMREALALFEAERPSLLAAAGPGRAAGLG